MHYSHLTNCQTVSHSGQFGLFVVPSVNTYYFEDNYCARPVCATTVITHYIPTMLFQSVVVTSSIVISLKTSLANFNPETLTDVRGSIPGRGRVIPKLLYKMVPVVPCLALNIKRQTLAPSKFSNNKKIKHL